jgi:hypothetical protein
MPYQHFGVSPEKMLATSHETVHLYFNCYKFFYAPQTYVKTILNRAKSNNSKHKKTADDLRLIYVEIFSTTFFFEPRRLLTHANLKVEMEWSGKKSCKPLLPIILPSPFPS